MLQEVGGGDEGDTDWERRHTGCDDIHMVSRWCTAEDISDNKVVVFFYLLKVLENADMSGKTKKRNIGTVSKNIFIKIAHFILQDAKGMLHRPIWSTW